MVTRLLTTHEIARKLDVPNQWIERMTRRGELLPDGIAGRHFLFSADRLDEIAQRVRPSSSAEEAVAVISRSGTLTTD